MASSLPFAGLDGCHGGWVCARWDGAGALELSRLARVEDLFADGQGPEIAAIDIPIGLSERTGLGGRAPERLVRPLLGMRQSSVFSVPPRAAVMAGGGTDGDEGERYRKACAASRAASEPSRAVSKQCFHIFPKILQVDEVLRREPQLRGRLLECHPEVSFRTMQGAPLLTPKKVKGRVWPEGLAARIALLAAQGMPTELLRRETAVRLKAGLDDVIDACACAWTARRIARGEAVSYPDPPHQDAYGLPVAIRA
ncbi:DUF429 domain-containing protein [Aquabacter sp. CN5-332]|uniref:DUF429 domain-containing protein n=1 Tax=Aquabacter sp. CN5-332 TaxID=3156608 RepID=UPI0032B4C927